MITARHIVRGLAELENQQQKWVFGYLRESRDGYSVAEWNNCAIWHPVRPETIGQCLGLCDDSDIFIFEGDVVEGTGYRYLGDGKKEPFPVKGVVMFDNKNDTFGWGIYNEHGAWDISKLGQRISCHHITGRIIGNVFQSSDLEPFRQVYEDMRGWSFPTYEGRFQ